MAYLNFPQYVTGVTIKIDVKLSNGEVRCDTVRFESDRDGRELTNRLTDTMLSAMRLAIVGRSSAHEA